MKLLITGGLGFIATNFIHLVMNETKHNIVNLDKVTYAANPNAHDKYLNNPRYTFIKGDICNKDIVDKAMKGIDVILNFAAESHVDNSIKDMAPFIQTNVLGTTTLLQSALENKIKLFIQISSDEVYGQVLKGRSKETNVLNPRNPYSASKAAAEMFVKMYHETYGLKTIITRSSNNYGPYQFPEKIIPCFITRLQKGEKAPLHGKGLQIREWIYVEDNCRGILKVMDKGKDGEIYNISSGYTLTNLQLTHKILGELKLSKEMIQHVPDRQGNDYRYSIDSSKTQAIGWKCKHDFKKGLQQTIQWYKANK